MGKSELRSKEPIREVIETYGETSSISGAKSPLKHGKMKKCRCKVCPAGLFITSKKRRAKFNGKGFISNFDIKSIELQPKNTVILRLSGDQPDITVSVPDPSEFVNLLCSWHNKLLAQPLSLVGFDQGIQAQEAGRTPFSAAFRYITACAKYKGLFDQATFDLFKRFDRGDRTSIVFSSALESPIHANTIVYPLIHEQSLNTVVFRGFAPVIVGRVVHSLCKKGKSVRTIVICDYDDFQFELMKFDKVENPWPVSFVFSNLRMPDARMPLLISEISEYRGSIQSLVWDQVKFTALMLKCFESFVIMKRCYLSLEVLRFSNLDVKKDTFAVFNFVIGIASRLPVLQRLSLNRWTNGALRLRPDPRFPVSFITSRSIRSLTITNVDLFEVLRPITFDDSVHSIEFASCRFNAQSMKNLFMSVRNIQHQVNLSIDRPAMTSADRALFWEEAKSFPVMDNIYELGWARNFITAGFVDEFCRIFITPTLRYLDISCVFRLTNKTELFKVLGKLADVKLWGLSIGGPLTVRDEPYDFQDIIVETFQYVKGITTLEYLDISRHSFTTLSSPNILEFCRSTPNLKQISCDSSKLASLPSLFEFYRDLAGIDTITAIRRPIADLNRLSHDNPKEVLNNSGFASFRDALLRTREPMTRDMRDTLFFECKDMSRAEEFQRKYPATLLESDVCDPYDLKDYGRGEVPISSLLDSQKNVCNSDFGDYQALVLRSPYEGPLSKPRTELVLPERMKNLVEYTEEPSHSESPPPPPPPEANVSPSKSMMTQKDFQLFRNIKLLRSIFSAFDNVEDPYPSVGTIPPPAAVVSSEVFEEFTRSFEGMAHEETDEYSESSTSRVSLSRSNSINGPLSELSYRRSPSASEIADEVSETSESVRSTVETFVETFVEEPIDAFEPEPVEDWVNAIPNEQPIDTLMDHEDTQTKRIGILQLPPAAIGQTLFMSSPKGPESVDFGVEYMEGLSGKLENAKQSEALERMRQSLKVLEARTPWYEVCLPELPMTPPVDTAPTRGLSLQEVYAPNIRDLFAKVVTLPREVRRGSVRSDSRPNTSEFAAGPATRASSVRRGEASPYIPATEGTAGPILRTLGSDSSRPPPIPRPLDSSARARSGVPQYLLQTEPRRQLPSLLTTPDLPQVEVPELTIDVFNIPDSVPSFVPDPMTIERAPRNMSACYTQLTRSDVCFT